jgi:hypothetical protein
MQEVPIVTVPVIVGRNSIEAVHSETPMITTIARTGTVKTVDVVAHDTGMCDRAHTDMIATFDGSDVSPAKPADMTHRAADVSAAASATQPGDVSTAADPADRGATAEAADVSASAEAAAHTASVAATAAAATARLCLRSKQTNRQKGRRQNRYHLFHRSLHSVKDEHAI